MNADPRSAAYIAKEQRAATKLALMRQTIAALPRSVRRKLKTRGEGMAAMMHRLNSSEAPR